MKHCLFLLWTLLFLSACSTNPFAPESSSPESRPSEPNTPKSMGTVIHEPGIESDAYLNKDTTTEEQQTLKPAMLQARALKNTNKVTISTAWDHIQNAETISIDDTHPRILKELDFYKANPDYIEILTERAAPYLHHILQRLEAENMPLELAVLPFIESAWLPGSTSKSGAAGLWQFMPATARHLGMEMDALYDSRRDLIHSTDNAIAYLSWLNSQFNDWLLALGAYNGGPGTISRAIKKSTVADMPLPTFWDLQLSEETTEYVPKFLAVLLMLKNPDYYNVTLHPIKNEAAFELIKVNRSLDIAAVAKKAGIPKDSMLDLNASYIRGVTHPTKNLHLLVPTSFTEDEITAIVRSMPEVNYPVATFRHKIRKGQTLSSISILYEVNIADLKLINGIKDNRIRAGDHLSIPAPVSTGSQGNKHIVKPGDTLWGIAKRYSVSITRLAKVNSIGKNAPLMPGMVLSIRDL